MDSYENLEARLEELQPESVDADKACKESRMSAEDNTRLQHLICLCKQQLDVFQRRSRQGTVSD